MAKREDPAVKEYRRFKEDINNWYANGDTLKYHADYRKWLSNFLCGDRSQCGAINWQDIGIPAYIVAERITDISAYYIEGQDVEENPENIPIVMERSVESRDALLALNELQLAKGWEFDGAVYYQQRLIAELMRTVGKLNEVEKLATSEGKKARDELAKLGIGGQHDELSQEVQEALNELYDRLEKMEVKDDTE